MQDFYLKEDGFCEAMKKEVVPFMKEHWVGGSFETKDHRHIAYRYCMNDAEKGAVVVSHGFCEFAEKFEETCFYFFKAGYSVFIIEHMGHGYSDRSLEDEEKVHIDSFETYVSDLHQFKKEVVE